MRRLVVVVVGLGALMASAGCTSSGTKSRAAIASPRPATLASPRATAAQRESVEPVTGSRSPSVPAAPRRTTSLAAEGRILDARITGPLTGAVLLASCGPLGYPCSFRVDTTTDGARTWRKGPALGGLLTRAPLEGRSLQRLAAIDARHLFAYASDFVSTGAWRSADGGLSWTRLVLPSSGYDLNAANGDVVEVSRPARLGNQDIGRFNVIDANGRVLPRSQFPVDGAFWTTDIVRTTTAIYVSAGDNSGHTWLMKSFDDGLTWSRLPAPVLCAGAYGQLTVVDGATLLQTCGYSPAPTRLLRSDDGGVRWRQVAIMPPSGLQLSATTAKLLWGINLNDIERSTDGGQHWQRVGIPGVPSQQDVGAVGSFTTRGLEAWWASADASPLGAPRQARLHVTTDAGRHWRTVHLPA